MSRAAAWAGANGGALNYLSLNGPDLVPGTTVTLNIGGATTGSALTATGLPSGWAINSAARTISGPVTDTLAADIVITETLAGKANSPRQHIFGLKAQQVVPSYDPVAAELARFATSADPWAMLRKLSPVHRTASKILRSAKRRITPITTVMASPPTRTEGAANIASTINGNAVGAPAYGQPGGAGARYLEAIGVYEAASPARDTSWTDVGGGLRRSAHGAGVRGLTEASVLEIALGGGAAANQPYAMYVTELSTGIRARVAVNDPLVTVTSAHYDKWDFGSAALRLIEIKAGFSFSGNISINGINMANTAMLAKAPAPEEPRIIYFGDSWGMTGGSQNTNPTSLLVPDFIGEQLGVANVLSLSVAGTGFLNRGGTGSSAKGTFGERIAAADADVSRIGTADLVILPGSINDDASNSTSLSITGSFSDADLTTAITSTVTAMLAKQPNAIIMGWGPQVTRAYPTTQARFDVVRAAWVALGATVVINGAVVVAGTNPRLVYIDNSPSGESWLFGTSTTGNVSVYFNASDQNHLGDLGQAAYGRRVGRSIAAALRAVYA